MSETPAPNPNVWKKCSSCKKPIAFKALYWVCNVSTCNRKRTGLAFCTVACWDAHQPMMNHRESWAEERKAPSPEEWAQILAEEAAPVKRARKPAAETPVAAPPPEKKPAPVLIRRARREDAN
ncbi:MAG: hypothetical protein JST04_16520 [Bdellovibrionales bacterium]|nr:hypothetical protein [Bdellovibrionales bacterium]